MPAPTARLMREAMGRFASGVTIVTTLTRDGTPVGCTVSAFCSLSLDPPLVLVCIGKGRCVFASLIDACGFAVNVLRRDQQDLARRFAQPGADRFIATGWRPGHCGVPLLDGAIVKVQCNRWNVLDGGDHVIVIGRVVDVATADGEPLLYAMGGFIDPPDH